MRIKPAARSTRLIGTLLLAATALALTSACSAKPVAKKQYESDSADAVRQKWLQCMRDAGQTGIRISDDGKVLMPAAGPSVGDSMAKALKACNAKVPGMQQLNTAKPDFASINRARGMAGCLRKHGVPNMADPEPDRPNILVMPAGIDSKTWDKALGICAKEYPNVAFGAEQPHPAGS
ncbi:hypothetical protein AB0D38_10835 [Streptomyces sp. NPDC048279]|uniref:hypothetical protein n=1 Tax=Streptomyces sp. NPDC048279 TaxID=3154714 RepID=UPI003440A577